MGKSFIRIDVTIFRKVVLVIVIVIVFNKHYYVFTNLTGRADTIYIH